MGRAINADEAPLAQPPLTSCCEVQFLTGHGLVPRSVARGLGIPELDKPGQIISLREGVEDNFRFLNPVFGMVMQVGEDALGENAKCLISTVPDINSSPLS